MKFISVSLLFLFFFPVWSLVPCLTLPNVAPSPWTEPFARPFRSLSGHSGPTSFKFAGPSPVIGCSALPSAFYWKVCLGYRLRFRSSLPTHQCLIEGISSRDFVFSSVLLTAYASRFFSSLIISRQLPFLETLPIAVVRISEFFLARVF